MSVIIKEVRTKRDLARFIDFPEKILRYNKSYVPPLFFDQKDTLDSSCNPAASFCESALYLAYKDDRIVGRVAAIVNNRANAQWNHLQVRFGWYDFVDDPEVSSALMEKVAQFGRQRGMTHIVGPLGFTDFDPEGLLVEGYEYDNTMPMLYNLPYYKDHIESMGFVKDADWQEFRLAIPSQMPERFSRGAALVRERSKVHTVHLTRKMVKKGDYGRKIFALINECYKNLYNFTVLPEDLADKYMNFYLSVLDLRYVCVVENEAGELVAFGISMPSLAGVLRKCRGHLLPFGWAMLFWRLLIRHSDGADLLLAGVRPDYQNQGITSLLFEQLVQTYIDNGVKWAESEAMLEDNKPIQAMFTNFEHTHPRRRRSYIKKL